MNAWKPYLAGLLAAAVLAAAATAALAQDPRRPGADRKRPEDRAPKQGDPAPDFTLKTPDGKTEVKLSALFGKRPVCLVFGSYTWPPFRDQAGRLEKLYAAYQDRVEFWLVYIREAHPSDGWVVPQNQRQGIEIKQPTDLETRREVAKKCTATLKLSLPTLVDTLEDTAEKGYSGWPDRIFVIGLDGKIAYRGGQGPGGFKVKEAEAALAQLVGKGGEEPKPDPGDGKEAAGDGGDGK